MLTSVGCVRTGGARGLLLAQLPVQTNFHVCFDASEADAATTVPTTAAGDSEGQEEAAVAVVAPAMVDVSELTAHLSRFAQPVAELQVRCILYIHIHIHTHIYIYIYIYIVCVCV